MTRRAMLLALCALTTASPARAGTKIMLVGRLFSFHPDSDNLDYALDPTGESEGIELRPNAGGYVADYLKGCEGRIVHVTIEPSPE